MLGTMKKISILGVSLVEVMVAIGVLAILVSVAAPSFSDLIARRRLQAVAAEIATDLAYARSETALRQQDVFLTFNQDASTTCYTIQIGSATAQCDCTKGAGLACPADILGPSPELKTLQVASSTGITFTPSAANWAAVNNKFGFSAAQMLPSLPDFGITVSNSKASLRVALNALGRVSTCSPNGSFGSGVHAC
jgi:type IV fimbrial biogenesis protein FimT